MRKFVIALLLSSAIISCKKTDVNSPIEPVENSIIGKWELRKSICGWGGSTNYLQGNGTTITFSSNGQYTAVGTRVYSGTYQLSTRINSQGQTENLLYLGGNWNWQCRFSINSNTLKLDENAFIYDGCEYNYQKIE